MNEAWLSTVVGCVVGLGCVLLIAVALRLLPRTAPVAVFAGCIALSELVVIAIGALWFDSFYLWQASAMVGLIGLSNFFVFGAVYKSVSLEMLGVLNAQPGGRASKSLLVEVVARPCVEQRMELLVEMGQVSKTADASYTPTPTGLKTVARLKKIQRFFGIYSSGLYGKT